MFDSNNLGDCVSEKSIVVVLFVEMQYLGDKQSSPELQPENLVIRVIYQNSCAVCLETIVDERYSDDIVALFVRNLEFSSSGEDDGGDRVVTEDYIVACDGIVEVVCNDGGPVVME